MSCKKGTYIAAALVTLAFIAFVSVYRAVSLQRAQRQVDRHARVIADDLWNYNIESSREYLSLACDSLDYGNISIIDTDGSVVLKIVPKKPTGWDSFSRSPHLFSPIPLKTKIMHNNSVIGTLEAQWYPSTLIISFYVLIPAVMLVVLIHLFLRILQTNRLLEDKVEERTSELSASNTELHNLRSYLSNIIDSMPSVLVSVNEHCTVTQWNRQAERSTGLPAVEAIGRKLTDVIPEMASEIVKVEEHIQGNDEESNTRRTRKKDGETIVEDITIYPLITDGQRGAVIRIDDITRQHELEQQLSQSRKMDAVGQLAGGISHDFNNMLGGIMGAAQLLKKRDCLDDKSRRYVEIILQAATQSATLTSQLLAFSRKDNLDWAPVDIHKLISETILLLERSIDKKVTMLPALKADKQTVEGDSAQLQNAIMNIIINAAQAMPDGGTITITTSNVDFDQTSCNNSPFEIEPGHYLRLSVKDTGCGIPQEHLSQIFEPFFTSKEQGKGTGLGLSAVYGIVQNHSGAISVQSEVGTGTTFRLFLPLSDTAAQQEDVNEDTIQGSGLVLLVEDEEVVRVTTEEMLSDLNYDIITARTGREAIDIFSERHEEIDVVLLDMIMPEMNGEEAFAKLREIDESVKVILCSGFVNDAKIDEMRKQGLGNFLRKPCKLSALSHALAQILAE